MKHIVIILAGLVWSLFSVTVSLAGEGSTCHFHGNKAAEETTVIVCAKDRRDLYLDQGTIEESWNNIEPTSLAVIDGKEGQEWRVLFKNESASEPSKQTLYMFFTLAGNFIAANYSGK